VLNFTQFKAIDDRIKAFTKKGYFCPINFFLLTNTRTVLCVDDDADDRELVCTVINEIDPTFKVVHAENGKEACSYLIDAKKIGQFPCLIILDINMPIMNGKETLVEIKKDEVLKTIPLAIYSTSPNPSDKAFFKSLGVEFVQKPNDLTTIAVEVGKLLNLCA
jgi:CheY-like chemotaxis protein